MSTYLDLAAEHPGPAALAADQPSSYQPSVQELRGAWAALRQGAFRRWPDEAGALLGQDDRGEPPNLGAGYGGWVPGPLVAVLAAAGGVGATTIAVALAQAIATEQGSARLVECASITATGLAAAADAELGAKEGWLMGRRGSVLIQRPDHTVASLPTLRPPPTGDANAMSVLDPGWEIGHVLGTSSWIRDALSHATAVVVSVATVPGIRRAEVALQLLDHHLWAAPAVDSVTAAVVVVRGPRRWPREATAAMGPRLRALHDADGLILLRPDDGLQASGVTPHPLPTSLQHAATTILHRTGAGTTKEQSPCL